MDCEKFDIAVIGAGPAGVAAALRAAKLGKKAALIERDKLGGTCLNRGCVPTKALLKSAEVYEQIKNSAEFGISVGGLKFDFEKIAARSRQVSAKILAGLQFSLKKSSVKVFEASAKILSRREIELDFGGEKKSIFAENILIASGSKPKKFAALHCESEKFLYSDGALNLSELPQSATILGAGAIGLEFAQIWSAFGVEVKLVEFKQRILPLADEEISRALARALSKRGVEICTSAQATACKACEGGFETEVRLADSSAKTLKSECVLCALGIEANLGGLFDETLGLELERGFIKTDEKFETSVPGIFACGDAAGKSALAHSAEWEAERAVEGAFEGKIFPRAPLPACVYTNPPAAWVGPAEAFESGANSGKYKVSKSFYLASAKAQADAATAGFVKIISDANSGKIAAASIFGEGACELISILTLAISAGMGKAELAGAVLPHPSLSELVKAACRD